MVKCLFVAVMLVAMVATAAAQQFLAGKIFRVNSREILVAVTLRNIQGNQFSRSDLGGNYRLPAVAGNNILVSSAGYLNDTIQVTQEMLFNGLDIYLMPNRVVLPGVVVDELSRYTTDSLKRREDYAFLLDKKHPVKLWNEKRVGDAPGLNFSPIGYFSKKETAKRKLKRKLKMEDEGEYVDAKFSEGRVAQLTKLTGDSLQQFLQWYRPSYALCRKLDAQLMLLYINDKLVLFRKRKSSKTHS